MEKKTCLSLLVENNFGVLSRISGLFARRGYNIDSLTVGTTENAELSDEEKAAIEAAEANGGINPMYAGKTDNDGGKAKKMSDKERT